MPKPCKVSKVDIRDYAERGAVYFKSFPPHVAIEVHFTSALLTDEQAMEALISFYKVCLLSYGDRFRNQFSQVVKVL